jgi:hypothetical protein
MTRSDFTSSIEEQQAELAFEILAGNIAGIKNVTHTLTRGEKRICSAKSDIKDMYFLSPMQEGMLLSLPG